MSRWTIFHGLFEAFQEIMDPILGDTGRDECTLIGDILDIEIRTGMSHLFDLVRVQEEM